MVKTKETKKIEYNGFIILMIALLFIFGDNWISLGATFASILYCLGLEYLNRGRKDANKNS